MYSISWLFGTLLVFKILVFFVFQGTKVCVCIQICPLFSMFLNFFWEGLPYIKVKTILFLSFYSFWSLFSSMKWGRIQFHYFQNVSTLFFKQLIISQLIYNDIFTFRKVLYSLQIQFLLFLFHFLFFCPNWIFFFWPRHVLQDVCSPTGDQTRALAV